MKPVDFEENQELLAKHFHYISTNSIKQADFEVIQELFKVTYSLIKEISES